MIKRSAEAINHIPLFLALLSSIAYLSIIFVFFIVKKGYVIFILGIETGFLGWLLALWRWFIDDWQIYLLLFIAGSLFAVASYLAHKRIGDTHLW